MAATSARRRGASSPFPYVLLGALIFAPLLAFGLGPLTGDDISLSGPGGPMVAFSAGVLSFVSPCVLPIVPIYLAQLSGGVAQGGQLKASRRVVFSHAAAFLGGLSIVFIVLGSAAGLLGSYFLNDNQRELARVAGLFLAAMGVLLIPEHGRGSPLRGAIALFALTAVYLFVAEVAEIRDDRQALLVLAAILGVAWLRYSGYLPLSIFSRTFELNVGRNRQIGYTRSALVGGAFGLGWVPCIGPVLGGIFTLAASSSEAVRGTYLLVAYSAGFSIPFLLTALLYSDATAFFRKVQRYSGVFEAVSAVMLIGLGLLLWYDRVTGLTRFFGFAEFNQGL